VDGAEPVAWDLEAQTITELMEAMAVVTVVRADMVVVVVTLLPPLMWFR